MKLKEISNSLLFRFTFYELILYIVRVEIY